MTDWPRREDIKEFSAIKREGHVERYVVSRWRPKLRRTTGFDWRAPAQVPVAPCGGVSL